MENCRKRCIAIACFLALGLLAHALYAVDLGPAQEQRANELFKVIRCTVCQGQSLHDSSAPLAQQMRALIRQKIHDQQTDEQILNYLVSRYGDEILFKPPLTLKSYLLWFLPAFILLGAGWLFVRNSRPRPRSSR